MTAVKFATFLQLSSIAQYLPRLLGASADAGDHTEFDVAAFMVEGREISMWEEMNRAQDSHCVTEDVEYWGVSIRKEKCPRRDSHGHFYVCNV